MKKTRLVASCFAILILSYSLIIVWKVSGWKLVISNQPPAITTKPTAAIQSDKALHKQLIFINLGSKWLNQTTHQFPPQLKIKQTLPSNWQVHNLLNFAYPQWNSLYRISQTNLAQLLTAKVTYVSFYPLAKVLVKWQTRAKLTLTQLNQITNLTNPIAKQLFKLIKTPQTSSKQIKAFLVQKIKPKRADVIWQRLQQQIIFTN